MTKAFKISLISFLTALFTLCIAALALPSLSANAETVEIPATANLSDDTYSFVPGAYISPEIFADDIDPNSENFNLATARTQLRFDFELTDLYYENFSNVIYCATDWWGNLAQNFFIYEFTLFRSNNDGDGEGSLGTAETQYSVLVVIACDENRNFYGYVAEKDYYKNCSLVAENYNDDNAGEIDRGLSFFLAKKQNTYGTPTKYDYIATKGYTGNEWGDYGKGYTIKYRCMLKNNNLNFIQDNGLKIRLIANVNSPYQYYYVRTRYCFSRNTGHSMFGDSYLIRYNNSGIYSSSRSVADVIQRMDDAGVDFEESFEDRAEWAYEIIGVSTTQRVRVKYLSEIEGTPYATHKYAYVDIPILQETVFIADVEAAVGESLGKCLDSNAYCFKKTIDDDGELYQLYYLKNIWLRSATVDGNYFDYFLDINKSYKDLYTPYVSAGILSAEAYEYIYSQKMLNKFPALTDYRFNEVYGYFGLVVVPETYTLNSALKTMFDVKTSKIGVISNFTFERSLSYEGYQELLDNYEYGFLSKLWSNVAGFVAGSEQMATYYVIYSEPGTENALIGEGGQTDAENPGSVVENEVIKPLEKVIGNAWNGIIDFFTGVSGATKTILYIVLGAVVLIVGFKVYGTVKGNKNSRRK